jgi:hypothetical protein
LLLQIIKKVHLIAPGANNAITQMKRMSEFATISQRSDEPVRLYLRRFKQAVEGLDYAGIPVPDEKVQSARFIDGLDKGKYSDMQRNLYNDSLGDEETYPATLNAAMIIAQQYLAPKKVGFGNTAAAFVTQKAGPKKKLGNKKNKSAESKNKEIENEEKKVGTVTCWGCGEEGHIRPNCPIKKKLEAS